MSETPEELLMRALEWVDPGVIDLRDGEPLSPKALEALASLRTQLQQAETALRAWLEFHSRPHTPDELFEMGDMTHSVLAALAAPPPNTKDAIDG